MAKSKLKIMMKFEKAVITIIASISRCEYPYWFDITN